MMDYMNFCPLRLFDRDFDSYLKPFHSRHYFRPWYKSGYGKEFGSTIQETKDKYKINLDVQHFQPNEINVKVTDKEIIIEGKHEERQEDSSFVSRHFTRRYPLPSNCPPDNVCSTLSSDGVLSVVAEKKITKGNEKIVPIQISGTCPMKTHMKTRITQTSTGITQKDIDDAIREARELISMDKAKLIKEEHSRLLKPELLKEAVTEKVEELNDKFNRSGDKDKMQSNVKLSDLMDEMAQSSSASSSETYGSNSRSETIREEKKSSSYKSSMTSSMKASEYISAELSDAAENV
ncbi:uncharacterized protein LOC115444229 [Manduca sexta]|uniref:SHSP domain-containing protein n=1 Tax=Manduca sexta TaxID=7130 RepID=A0A921Z6N6_MANSE|nr:uncharacterized protein LOC115444229 [Manduca sexta]KAG6451172.1 hypothetical protein O3G_MSEX006981 [Manduca sexta]